VAAARGSMQGAPLADKTLGLPPSRGLSMPPSKAPSIVPSKAPTMPVSLKSSSKTGAQAMAQALLAGDLGVAAQLAEERRRQEEGEEEERDEEEEEVEEDTSEEEELSESETDDDMARAAKVLIVSGATGGNERTINGTYQLSEEAFNGRPQWQKVEDNDKWLAFVEGHWFITSQSFKWLQRKDGFLQSNQHPDGLPNHVSEWKVKGTTGLWDVQPVEVHKETPHVEKKDSDTGATDAKSFAGTRRTSAGRGSNSGAGTRKSGIQQAPRGSIQLR